ncbi:gamma-glutamyltransferase family protein [Brevibacterium sp. 91QC2O2]|uniref:gamma-glutamyltransferase family protein n=1 Tax=Brevibacterium sp. 91QC2O2 TaxID=2968458 RepID=UPI00359CA225
MSFFHALASPANAQFTPAATHTTRPSLQGSFGMAASTHWLATATAQSVLERGGNAFDAAAAGAFVLHVVEPHLNGPAGDMTGVLTTAPTAAEPHPAPQIMMGQGDAPAGASVEAYKALGLDFVPGAGALAAAIPTSVDMWLNLLITHGSWELPDVLAYAIHYAEHGHAILASATATIARVKDLFTEHWPSSADLWLTSDGQVPAPGTTVRNPEYAQVLRELAAASAPDSAGAEATSRAARIQAARDLWHTGRVAQTIAEFVKTPHRHADGGDYAGVITAADLARECSRFEAPASVEFRGYTVSKIGAWGQGPILLQALKILDGFSDDRLDPSSELGAHTILETLKLVLADRDVYYGDADTDATGRVLEYLLSDEYAAERRTLITDTASAEFRPGTLPAELLSLLPGGSAFAPPLIAEDEWAQYAAAHAPGAGQGSGEPTMQTNDSAVQTAADGTHRGDTCHIDVVDRWGNAISATPSGGWLQSSPTVPGLGFCLGTRLQMTWLDESSPSALTPGKRPRTTLSPTLIQKDGQTVAVLGTPGGDQQDQWQLLLVLRLLVGEYEPQQAIDAPAFHTNAMPASFYPRTWDPASAVVEDRLGEAVIDGLRARGHRVTCAGDWALGRLSAITRDPATGDLQAAANPRGAQGYAAGR